MQSIAVYGRVVVRAVLSELTGDLPRALPWHGNLASAQPLRKSFHLVTAASGLSKTHSTSLASSQKLLKPRTFGDDACFVARHKLGDVIGALLRIWYFPSLWTDSYMSQRYFQSAAKAVVRVTALFSVMVRVRIVDEKLHNIMCTIAQYNVG